MKYIAFVEQRSGQIKKNGFEVVRASSNLAKETNSEVIAVIIGKNISSLASELGGFGANKVIVIDDARLENYSTTAFASIINQVVKKENGNILFLSATAMGRDLAPRLSVKLNAGLAVDCTSLKNENGKIIATRPVYAGKGLIEVSLTTSVQIFSLRPNVFNAGDSSNEQATIENFTPELNDEDFKVQVVAVETSSGKKDVAESSIIVSGGRGLRESGNFGLVEKLAEVLGAAVGASRAVVDAGWRPHEEQVGQTGKTVSPTLYIAVGISGAVQHLAGMSSSKCIVAINKDKEAPIFSIANYGITGDAFEILPALTSQLKIFFGKS
ncbi:MAG: electron transfer flavoprotein subunit alpha/FixB family protein [Bacteroidota bacterium]